MAMHLVSAGRSYRVTDGVPQVALQADGQGKTVLSLDQAPASPEGEWALENSAGSRMNVTLSGLRGTDATLLFDYRTRFDWE